MPNKWIEFHFTTSIIIIINDILCYFVIWKKKLFLFLLLLQRLRQRRQKLPKWYAIAFSTRLNFFVRHWFKAIDLKCLDSFCALLIYVNHVLYVNGFMGIGNNGFVCVCVFVGRRINPNPKYRITLYNIVNDAIAFVDRQISAQSILGSHTKLLFNLWWNRIE